jgi:hypothetical protein
MKPLDTAIIELLVERGWKHDPPAAANKQGELMEMIHPQTGKRYTVMGAVYAHGYIEAAQSRET